MLANELYNSVTGFEFVKMLEKQLFSFRLSLMCSQMGFISSWSVTVYVVKGVREEKKSVLKKSNNE